MTHCKALPMLVATLALGCSAAPEIVIENAWVRTPPPGMSMTAAYFELNNRTPETVVLVGAAADTYGSVTVHESRLVDGVWQMIPMPSLSIGAGEKLQFKPGGLHLMMMKPGRTVARGEQIAIRLQFADGRIATGSAIVHDSSP